MALFDSNAVPFFADGERAEFHDYLASLKSPYWVVQHGARVIGCGGVIYDFANRRAGLAWGMIDRAFHGHGIGRLLVEVRLQAIRGTGRIQEVLMDTSQHTSGFYQRMGFQITAIETNGYGAGLDRVTLIKRLD